MFPWNLEPASCEMNNVPQNKLESTKQYCEAIEKLLEGITPELLRTSLHRSLDMLAINSIKEYHLSPINYLFALERSNMTTRILLNIWLLTSHAKFTVWSGVPEVFGGAIHV